MSAAISSHRRTMQFRAGGKKFTVVRLLPAGSGWAAWLSAVSELPELVMLSSVMAPSAGNARTPPLGRPTSFGRMCRYPPAPVVTSTECRCGGPRSLCLCNHTRLTVMNSARATGLGYGNCGSCGTVFPETSSVVRRR